jgi:hypothetical protein
VEFGRAVRVRVGFQTISPLIQRAYDLSLDPGMQNVAAATDC